MKQLIFVLTAFITMQSCSGSAGKRSELEQQANVPKRDLDEILASGKLIALTDFSSSSYFIYKGIPMGFEYELMQRFCDHLGVNLEVRVVDDMDMVVDLLNTNSGDVIAANYTITNQRKRAINFTLPLLETKQVLVQRLPEKWWTYQRHELDKMMVKRAPGLVGKTVHVRRHSSFYNRLIHLMDEIGGIINIRFADAIGTEKLIEMVATGEIDYTVADENVALLNKAYFQNIDVSTPLSFTQHVAWATRKTSPKLMGKLNLWLEEFKKTEDFAVIYLKYFKARTQHKERVLSEYSTLNNDKISPYDALIKSHAQRLKWDWKLLAALIYQESKFDPIATSWTGASGLMQLIPPTAERFGADSIFDPEQNIHAGVSFLITLQAHWANILTDSSQVVPFTLASYNVGLGHVLDAVRLAEKYGSDSQNWEYVSTYLELKSQPRYYQDEVVKHGYCRGSEPVKYVTSILNMWSHYRNAPI